MEWLAWCINIVVMNHVRLRFAPSPTGGLHIGGVRTALFNYLFAKRHGGSFVLRIEDTDQSRKVEGSEAYIEESLAWLGLSPDEGPLQGGPFAPYRQSERKAIYGDYVQELLNKGKAYYAFDTVDSLQKMRQRQAEIGVEAPKYNALTRMGMENSLTLSANEVKARLMRKVPFVVRLLVDPRAKIRFQDEVRGYIQVKGSVLDDKVLLKEDGMPTYHLAHVVDDHLMQMTHIVRGEEWLPSTPIHQLLYEAFAWKMPTLVHLPLLLRADGCGKLSKRTTTNNDLPIFPLNWEDKQLGSSFTGFRESGYLAEALCNFLALLGWNPGGQQEVFDREALIEHFSLKRVHKGSVRVDLKKARWFNQCHFAKMDDHHFATIHLIPSLHAAGYSIDQPKAISLAALLKQRITFVDEVAKVALPLLVAPRSYPLEVIKSKWNKPYEELLKEVITWLQGVEALPSIATLRLTISSLAQKHKLLFGHLMALIRLALTAQKQGPHLFELICFLGKQEVVLRLEAAALAWKTLT